MRSAVLWKPFFIFLPFSIIFYFVHPTVVVLELVLCFWLVLPFFVNSLRSSSHLLFGLPTDLLVWRVGSSPGCHSNTLLFHLDWGKVMILRAILHFVLLCASIQHGSLCFSCVLLLLRYFVWWNQSILLLCQWHLFLRPLLLERIHRCPGLCLSLPANRLQFLCQIDSHCFRPSFHWAPLLFCHLKTSFSSCISFLSVWEGEASFVALFWSFFHASAWESMCHLHRSS